MMVAVSSEIVTLWANFSHIIKISWHFYAVQQSLALLPLWSITFFFSFHFFSNKNLMVFWKYNYSIQTDACLWLKPRGVNESWIVDEEKHEWPFTRVLIWQLYKGHSLGFFYWVCQRATKALMKELIRCGLRVCCSPACAFLGRADISEVHSRI